MVVFILKKIGNLNYFTIDGEYENVSKPEGYLSVLDISRGKSPIFQKSIHKVMGYG